MASARSHPSPFGLDCFFVDVLVVMVAFMCVTVHVRASLLRHGQSHPSALLVEPLNIMALFGDPVAFNRQLLKYVMAGNRAFEEHGRRSYFAATDKANVGGVSLNNIFWTLSTN